MYYLFLFLTLLTPNIDSFITNFPISHSSFLNSSIKKIEFNYSINNANTINPDGFIQFKVKILSEGRGLILMGQNHYKLLLNNHIILSDNSTMKTYNKKSNQIIIENSNFELDSLVLNFFNNLENNFKNNFYTIDLDNNCIMMNYKKFKVQIFVNNNSITSIDYQYNDLITNISSINLSPYINDGVDTLFTINAPDAFILDLRD